MHVMYHVQFCSEASICLRMCASTAASPSTARRPDMYHTDTDALHYRKEHLKVLISVDWEGDSQRR